MTVNEIFKGQLEFTRFITEQVSQDLTDNHLTILPENFGNPGIWILGHIAINRANYICYGLGEKDRLPEGWSALFGRGSTISKDLSIYPSATEIREFMKKEYAATMTFLLSLTDADLQRVPVIPSQIFKTVAEVFYATTTHEAYHAGQFGLIRRLVGLSTLG